jgi:hypothetical protein
VPRFGFEPVTMALSATTMAVMVLLVGYSIDETSQPTALLSRPTEGSGDDPGSCQRTVLTPRLNRAVSGAALLCVSGTETRLTLKASGVAPAARYAIGVSQAPLGVSCGDGPCPPTSLLGDSQGGPVETIGERIATLTGEFEVADELLGRHHLNGSRISVLVLRPGTAELDAEAVFVVP